MKQNFIKYYLPIFGSCLTLVIPIALLNYKDKELVEIIIALSILVIFLTLLLGTFYYKFGDKISQKQRKTSLKKDLFREFIYKGFDDNEVSVSGYLDNYFIIISDERDSTYPNKWIEVVILFNPKQQHQFIPNAVFNKLYKQGNSAYSWNSNSLTIKKVYGISLPKYYKIKAIIEEAINLLKENNISSIREEAWNLSLEESLIHYKQVSNLKN